MSNNFETNAFINPFSLFNIKTSSSLGELKKAYYELSLMCHPDKGGKTEDMMVVTNAYRFIKEQLINNDNEVELVYENAEEEFQKYVENNPIPKAPLFSEVFEEYTEFNAKFNKEYEKNENLGENKLNRLGYGKLMVESRIKECLDEDNNYDYNKLLELERLEINETKEEKREEFKNRFSGENILFLENNKEEKEKSKDNNYFNIYKPDYPDNARHTALILANDPLHDSYYDYSIEENLKNIENLDEFPEEEVLKKLNIDFGSKNYSDYYQSSQLLSFNADETLNQKINNNVMNQMELLEKQRIEEENKFAEERRLKDIEIEKKVRKIEMDNFASQNEFFRDQIKYYEKEFKKIIKNKNKAYQKMAKLRKSIRYYKKNKNSIMKTINIYKDKIENNHNSINRLKEHLKNIYI